MVSNPVRLVAFVRQSSSGQIGGHGRERQEEDEIASYAAEIGAEIVDTWRIVERATIFDRPAFEDALERAITMRRAGQIDGLIVASVDRLSRDPYDGGSVCRTALMAGLRLLFAAEGFDANDERDQERIMGALSAARAYARRLKAQTMPARRARAKQGKIPNGMVPWPYDYSTGSDATGRPTVNPERAAWVRRWVEVLNEGGTLGTILDLMNESGLPSPRGRARWSSRGTITRILKNRALVGEFYFGKEKIEEHQWFERGERKASTPELIFKDDALAILSEREWRLVQERLDTNKALNRRNTKREYGPLQRRVRCGTCDRSMGVVAAHSRFPTYLVGRMWTWTNCGARFAVIFCTCSPATTAWNTSRNTISTPRSERNCFALMPMPLRQG